MFSFVGLLSMFLDLKTLFVLGLVMLITKLAMLKSKNTPPGPYLLPLIGNVLFFRQTRTRHLFEIMMEASLKYGNIISLKSGAFNFVYLQGYKTLYQAFVKQSDEFSTRPSWIPAAKYSTKEGKGILWESGKEWKLMRRFALQSLRDFGVGKSSLEEKILMETNEVSRVIRESNGKPVNMQPLASKMIVNIIYGIIFGSRFEYNDGNFSQLISALDGIFRGPGHWNPSNAFPDFISKRIFKKEFEARQKNRFCIDYIRSHIYDEIDHHKETFDLNNVRDFVDLYIQTSKNENDATTVGFTTGNLYRTILDLFVAGSETTMNSISWLILYLIEYPDVQRQCYEEIQQQCGRKDILWNDRGKMPFVESMMLEVQRISNVAPFTIFHTNTKETTLEGYTIPKDSIIVGNLYSANLDQKHWDKPMEFRPMRFIGENGKLIKNPSLVPFGLGPRMCVGEILARMEMFLIFTNLLQRFEFKSAEPAVKHSFKSKFGQVTRAPTDYETLVIPRN